jgi:putative MATE family efflux protein
LKDLTTGSISGHLLRLAMPMFAGMVFQTLYYIVDLYFVAQLGDSAVAGVAAAGNVQFIILALTQVLGVGTMAVIAQSVGRRDLADANLVFNQSNLMAAACAALVTVGGILFTSRYMTAIGANVETTRAGISYLYWYLPGLALQFALVSMGAALRGTGIVKPTMIVQMFTVVLNAILAPILIAGWITGRPMGVAGAGLASTISIAVGVVMVLLYFVRLEKHVHFDRTLLPFRADVWARVLRIGLPTGGEFALMFLYMALIYWLIRDFGAPAQAGFGIGVRVMQSIFLPAMAVAFAAAPLAGQNVGAGHGDRVRDTFRTAALISCAVMVVLTLVCQLRSDVFIRFFTHEEQVVAIGADYLRIISWNFIASGLIFTCSGIFQALGNTIPSLVSSATRIVTFAVPAIVMSQRQGFTLRQLWWLSVATVAFQALFAIWLCRRSIAGRFGVRTVAVA